MNNKLLDNLETDINLLIKDKFHPKHVDLMNITIGEEVLELIKFARKVNDVFEKPLPLGTNDQYRGFKACFETLKREIYER